MKRRTLRGLLMVAAALWGCGGQAAAGARSQAAGYSSTALYNLANAYARAGKPGLAVLNYERASLLAPDDPDIEANLAQVRRSSSLPPAPTSRMDRAIGAVHPAVAAWIGVAGLMILAAALLAGPLRFPYRWARRAAAVIGLALLGLTAANGVRVWPTLHEAIVVSGSAPVRVSPAPMGDALFHLKEAEAVRMAGEYEGFVLVRDSNGRSGWVWHADLAPVVPRTSSMAEPGR